MHLTAEDHVIVVHDHAFDDGQAQVVVRVWPESGGGGRGLFFCVPGGTYDRTYFDLQLPGYDGYSMAEFLSARGYAVVMVDHVGTGDSATVSDGWGLTRDVLARANQEVLDWALAQLYADAPRPPVIGVGHSLGAMMLITQQDLFAPFERVALLGWTNKGHAVDWSKIHADRPPARTPGPSSFSSLDRSSVATLFFWPDIPQSVLDADTRRQTLVPKGVQEEVQIGGIVADAAAAITTRVFLAFGEVDTAAAPEDEPGYYANSPEVELTVVAGSGHCHNLSGTRAALWERLAQWAARPN